MQQQAPDPTRTAKAGLYKNQYKILLYTHCIPIRHFVCFDFLHVKPRFHAEKIYSGRVYWYHNRRSPAVIGMHIGCSLTLRFRRTPFAVLKRTKYRSIFEEPYLEGNWRTKLKLPALIEIVVHVVKTWSRERACFSR